MDIFKAKISTKKMADKIIEWRRSHTRTSTEDMGEKITTWKRKHQGRGHRHRGMAKSWQLFLDAEDILFFPLEIEKKFKECK